MPLKKIILRYCTGQHVGFDSTDPETEIPINANDVPATLNQMEVDFPLPDFEPQYGPDITGLAQYIWERVAIPS